MPRPRKSKTMIETSIEENTIDLVKALDIIDSLNQRVYELEKKLEDQIKLHNVTTNTLNYLMASMYVFEEYLVEFGVDPNTLKEEIDDTFYDAFNKKNKKGREFQYNQSIIKKINDQLLIFQEKLNEN